MRLRSLLVLALALFCPASCQRAPPGPADLVITDVTVVDVVRGSLAPGNAIVIRGNTIREVALSHQIPVVPGTKTIEGTGKYAVPGLWDMHVHTGPGEVFLPLYIANGITGIRDMGGDLPKATGNASLGLDTINQWREAISRGALEGPRIVATGPILDGPEPCWPGVTMPVESPEAARELVRALKRRGADFVKVYEYLPRETYFAIADESKKNGLPFAGHVPRALTASEASRAGQKSIEHLSRVFEEQSMSWPELLALFSRNGTWHVPTLTVKRDLVTNDDSFLDDERLRYVPEYMKAIWKESWWHDPCTAEEAARQRAVYRALLGATRQMHEAGVGILAGSDAANPYTYPGFGLHDELERLVDAGLTPVEALRAATTEPARFLDRRDLGTIESGKLADIVLLDADPLTDIRNTRRIHAVIADGRYFARERLQGMLEDAAEAARRMRAE